jgi:hypothetical protein
MHITEMELENMNWIPLAHVCSMERFCEQGDEPSGPIPLGIISPTDNSITRQSINHTLGWTLANKSYVYYVKFESFMAVKFESFMAVKIHAMVF